MQGPRTLALSVALALALVSPAHPQEGGTRTGGEGAGPWPLHLVPLRGRVLWRAEAAGPSEVVEAPRDLLPGATLEAPVAGAAAELGGALLWLADAEVSLKRPADEAVLIDLIRGDLLLDDRAGPLAVTIVAGSATISLIGTRVGVRRDEDRVRVYVEEGRVQVAAPGGTVRLEAREEVLVVSGTPGEPEPYSGEAGSWRGSLGRRTAVLRAYGRGAVECYDADETRTPRALSEEPDGTLRLEVPDSRWVKLTWEGVSLTAGGSYLFEVEACTDRARAAADLFVFTDTGSHDYGELHRSGALDDRWRRYRIWGTLPAGFPTDRPVKARLSVQGPGVLRVRAPRWLRLEDGERPLVFEPFGGAGAVGRARWDPLEGAWRSGGRGGMEAGVDGGGIGLSVASGPAPRGPYAFGGYVEPAPGGEAGLVVGLRDAAHFHWVAASTPPGASGPTRVRVLQVKGGVESVLAEAAVEGSELAHRLFDLRVRDGRLDVYREDRRLLVVRPYEPAGRGYGMAARGPGGHLFDNLLLRREPGY